MAEQGAEVQERRPMIPYNDLIARKKVLFEPKGMTKVPALNPAMFHYQQDVTDFLLRCGCGGAYLATGMGKSLVALDWARVIVEHTNKSVLMLAPLAVGPQHQREAERFGIAAKYVREPDAVTGAGVWITNYERLHKFDVTDFAGVVCDESSIMKSFTGATTRHLMATFEKTRFRLACSATPSPNDHMELGQQCQFLGIMDSNEMLARRHLCPMPLDLTERIVRQYSNPGDVVLSPFMGIGSEGYVALRSGRKFVGMELSGAYYSQAVKYLAEVEAAGGANNLFARMAGECS